MFIVTKYSSILKKRRKKFYVINNYWIYILILEKEYLLYKFDEIKQRD